MHLGRRVALIAALMAVAACDKKDAAPTASSTASSAAAPATVAAPAAAPGGCPAGYTSIGASNTTEKLCARVPSGCKYVEDNQDIECDGEASHRAEFGDEGKLDECLKKWGDIAKGKDKSMGKVNTLDSEGDMPSKKGHWFQAKTPAGNRMFACVQLSKGAVGCYVNNDTKDAKLLGICKDLTPVP